MMNLKTPTKFGKIRKIRKIRKKDKEDNKEDKTTIYFDAIELMDFYHPVLFNQ